MEILRLFRLVLFKSYINQHELKNQFLYLQKKIFLWLEKFMRWNL